MKIKDYYIIDWNYHQSPWHYSEYNYYSSAICRNDQTYNVYQVCSIFYDVNLIYEIK